MDTGLTSELQQAFKNTGTAHIIAISGFNISIIAGIFFAFFSRFLGPRRGAVLAILGIVFYTFLVGADAAVVRAAIMGSLALFARQVGRRQVGAEHTAGCRRVDVHLESVVSLGCRFSTFVLCHARV